MAIGRRNHREGLFKGTRQGSWRRLRPLALADDVGVAVLAEVVVEVRVRRLEVELGALVCEVFILHLKSSQITPREQAKQPRVAKQACCCGVICGRR